MKLTFIPSDFVNLNIPIGYDEKDNPTESMVQFMDNNDCPVARAVLRHGYTQIEDKKVVPLKPNIKYSSAGVDEIRQRLLGGEETVTIEI